MKIKKKTAYITSVVVIFLIGIAGIFYSMHKKNASQEVLPDIFLIFINGVDEESGRKNGNSDVNVVLKVDQKKRSILVFAMSRNTYAKMPEREGVSEEAADKLANMGRYGTEYVKKAVEALYGIDIPYYASVDFSGMKKIVNKLGGVSVYSDQAFHSDWGPSFQQGYNEVNGKQALAFCRQRRSFANGEQQRIRNHEYMIQAIFQKAVQPKSIKKYPALIRIISKSVHTNISQKQMMLFAEKYIKEQKEWTVDCKLAACEEKIKPLYTMKGKETVVLVPQKEAVEEMKNELLQGKE